MTFTTPVEGEPYTDSEPDDITAYLSAHAGGWTSYTPELADQGGTFEGNLAPTSDFSTMYYGDAPFGRWRLNNGRVEDHGRVITGSAFDGGGVTFDPGSGFYYLPLHHAPASWVTGAIGVGQISLPDQNIFQTVHFECDPVLDMAAGLAAPGDRAPAPGVAWIFLEGGPFNPNMTEMVVGAANPAVPDALLILAYSLDYPAA